MCACISSRLVCATGAFVCRGVAHGWSGSASQKRRKPLFVVAAEKPRKWRAPASPSEVIRPSAFSWSHTSCASTSPAADGGTSTGRRMARSAAAGEAPAAGLQRVAGHGTRPCARTTACTACMGRVVQQGGVVLVSCFGVVPCPLVNERKPRDSGRRTRMSLRPPGLNSAPYPEHLFVINHLKS